MTLWSQLDSQMEVSIHRGWQQNSLEPLWLVCVDSVHHLPLATLSGPRQQRELELWLRPVAAPSLQRKAIPTCDPRLTLWKISKLKKILARWPRIRMLTLLSLVSPKEVSPNLSTKLWLYMHELVVEQLSLINAWPSNRALQSLLSENS